MFLIIRPVISPCNPANFTCYTHARNPHALLRVFRPPHRHWHGTAPAPASAQSPPQHEQMPRMAIHAPGTALNILKTTGAGREAFDSRLELATWGTRPLSTTLFPRFSLVPARPRLGPIALLEGRQISRAPRPSHWPCAVSKSQQLNYSARCMCKQLRRPTDSTPLRAVQLFSCRAACITSTACLLPAPWPSLTRILPTAGLPSTTTRSPMTR